MASNSLPKTILFSSILSNAEVTTVRAEVRAILSFKSSKGESQRDVSVTRIGDILSNGFPQTANDDVINDRNL